MGFRPDCRRYGMDFAFSPVKGKKMQKRIVVLGGVGFIGSHLCLRLLNDGHEVFCVDIRDTADSPLLRDMPPHPEFRYVRHNIVNAFGIRCDEIYNLAAPSRVRYNKALPVESLKVSILGSINALDTARSEHARILYASTGDIYGTGYRDTSVEAADGCPTHRTLAEGKRAGEALHRAYQYEFGVDARIARIFNTYGSGADLMDQRVVMKMIVAALQNRDIPINGSGEQLRTFCWVEDVVDGLVRLMDAHGQFRQQSRGDDPLAGREDHRPDGQQLAHRPRRSAHRRHTPPHARHLGDTARTGLGAPHTAHRRPAAHDQLRRKGTCGEELCGNIVGGNKLIGRYDHDGL